MKKNAGRIALTKTLKQKDIFALALGAIIGWGCFVLPGNLFLPTAGPLGAAIGLIGGGLMMIIISSSYGYLVKNFPVAGGAYAFAYKGFGRNHAFICGWFLTMGYLAIVPLNATALAMIGRYTAPGLIQKGYMYSISGWEVFLGEIILASMALIVFAYVNIRGIKIAGFFQRAIVIGLLGSIFVLAIVAFMDPMAKASNLLPGFPTGSVKINSVLAILAIAPWAYVGFDCIPQAAEEFDFSPGKTFKLMAFAILFGCFCYVVINTITAVVLPWEEFIRSGPFWATGTATKNLLGTTGLLLLTIAISSAIIGGINGFYLATSRLLFSMARAKCIPEWFGRIHPKYNTPANAVIFIGATSLLAPWFGRAVLNWIVDMSATGVAIAYFYTSATAYLDAKKTGGPKKTRIMGLIGGMFSIGFLVLLLVPGMPGFLSSESWVALIVWTILGIIFYAAMSKKYRGMPTKDLDYLIFGNQDLP